MNISVKLPERVDTQNAPKLQALIDDEILKSGEVSSSLDVILDADEMLYISSAGLRCLLSTKKKTHGVEIINASDEVCEIFETTGFDEFIKISSKVPEISIDGLEIIGAGSNSKVYRLNAEKVVKVFNDETPYDVVLNELEKTRKAIALGVDTMISYGVVKVGNTYGAIYEMLDAKSILDWIKDDPENERYYLELFVEFVKKNHELVMKESAVPSVKKIFYDRIDKLAADGFYSADEAMTARQIVYSIPDKDTYIHGDCHIGNVLLSKESNELYFVDLPGLSKGNPIFDLFGMAWMRLAPKTLSDDKLRSLIGIDGETLERLWKEIISIYYETKDEKIIDEFDRQLTALECLNLSMAETYVPDLFDKSTLEWLKAEGLKAVDFEF